MQEKPILKAPDWGTSVIGYLFLGGLMGGSAILAALAQSNHSKAEARLQRNAALSAFLLAGACPAVLISHLGRPERFLNMLRVVKFKSPMSLGAWALVAFSAVSGLNLVTRSRPLGMLAAAIGAFVAGYTGVLLSATAVPLWAKGKYHIPAISLCSAVSGACALQNLLLLRGDNGAARERLERLEIAASSAELLLLLSFERFSTQLGAPMWQGARGRRFQMVTMRLGLLAPIAMHAALLFSYRSRGATPLRALPSLLSLCGGYVLRETLVQAGKESAAQRAPALRQVR
ncbi:MAG: hypothetical protein DLM50_01430 [Candidatus Meridianibacter frigidus]|nr:MAG: hypothetical protein DLM50_01430 [Candidatus Eremiobacteraeota bacterium]